MAKVQKDLQGLSESAWVSLAVKALRMGWPNGVRAAIERLSPSKVKGLAICGLFEDVFPIREEFYSCHDAIKAADWDKLCAYQTHHGRGYSELFCDMEKEAVAASRDQKIVERLIDECRQLGIYMSARGMNCLYTWLLIAPQRGGLRTIDETPFTTMPAAMLDMHTLEGKEGTHGARRVTILSGSYAQHRELGRLVMTHGWEKIRRKVHGQEAENPGDKKPDPGTEERPAQQSDLF